MQCVHEFLCTQVALSHFENHLSLSNVEQAIRDQYDLFAQEINYEKLKGLRSDFYESSSDISLFHLFQNAFKYSSHHKEAYSDIKNLFFEINNYFEQIVFHCNEILISIEIVVHNYISFCASLMIESDYGIAAAAYELFKALKFYQKKNIFDPLIQITEQAQCVKSAIENIVLKSIYFQEHTVTSYIKKLQKPMFLLQVSLPEMCNLKTYLTNSYGNVQKTMQVRLNMYHQQKYFKTMENDEIKKLFLKYFSDLLALYLLCKDVKSIFEDLLINFRSFIYEI